MGGLLGGVLVGGASTRFGSDKAQAAFGNTTLLDHQLSTLQSAGCSQVAYVGGALRTLAAPPAGSHPVIHIPDFAPGEGPLAGLLALLDYAAVDPSAFSVGVLMVACDLPLLTSTTARRIVDALEDRECDVAVASASRDHWSCVAVRISQGPLLRDAFARGERALHRALKQTRLVRVLVDEMEMLNVNEKSTLAQAVQTVTTVVTHPQ